MRDSILELWLRLLALHLRDCAYDDTLVSEIRNQWLLASNGVFNGWVPHDLARFTDSKLGRKTVTDAIHSLMNELRAGPSQLDAGILNLLGIEGTWNEDFPSARLIDVGAAFLDLIDGKLTCTVESTEFMPGST